MATADSVKAKLQGLIDSANAKTGNTDTDLTTAVNTLIEGYGSDSAIPTEVSTEAEMTALLESGEVGGVYKYTGESTSTYENGELYVLGAVSYLTFSSPNSFTLGVVDGMKYWNGIMEYSTNASTWNVWDGTTTLSADDGKLYMRGTGNIKVTGEDASSEAAHWVLTGSDIVCSGDIESLLDYVTVANGERPTMSDNCYAYMFYGCTSLTTAPELPATTLVDSCYAYMFSGCTSLTTAPELPAITLTGDCYSGMFSGCTGLTTAPELPATILADYCYGGMFYGCTSLTAAPNLPAPTLNEGCYRRMFYGCTSLTEAPELPVTTLASYCYHGMFYGCTGLTIAPELPSTTLASYCYGDMFRGCTSLIKAPELPATTLAYYCYEGMFYECTSLTTAPKLPATTLDSDCYWYMFYGCTSLTAIPALPATALKSGCYYAMFCRCTSIKLSTTQTDEYTTAYRIPTSGTGSEWNTSSVLMFSYTGGTFTGQPSINTTYYLHTSNTVVK